MKCMPNAKGFALAPSPATETKLDENEEKILKIAQMLEQLRKNDAI